MNHRSLALTVLLVATFLMSGLVPAAAVAPPAPAAPGTPALIRVPVAGPEGLAAVEAVDVPVYAHLIGQDGGAYLLAGATSVQVTALRSQGLAVTVLDADSRGASYYLAYRMPGRDRPDWSAYGRLLLDEGAQVLLRAVPSQAERLALAGAEIVRVTFDPKPLRPAAVEGAFPESIVPDPTIQSMIDQVDQTDVYSYTGDLSGEWPVSIGGLPYTIASRHTYSGTPIQKATQYVGEHLADLGLDVEYHQWSGSTYPNVIGELPGLVDPDQIYIIGAHLDDMPSGGLAPGADDNASGSVATLLAADILTDYQWGCTLRFAFWTGEEQGLLGSAAYAQRAYNSGENIAGYLNLDMIAWNAGGSNPDIDLHAKATLPQTVALAQLFADVVDAYDLNLVPQIYTSGMGASDHASFWQYGYTSILGIEDMSDFNPYYHTINDDMDSFQDWPYYVDFVQASLGTFAHMTGCLIQEGTLDGHVTVAGDGAPIPAATVTAAGQGGDTFQVITGADGYFTVALPAGLYDVTASKEGYSAQTVPGVEIQAGVTTTQDLALQPVPVVVVEPPALQATLAPGQMETQTLWITNTGAAPLDFWLHEMTRTLALDAFEAIALTLGGPESDLPWLSETPAGGTLAPGEGVTIAVTFDAGGLEPGNYLGLLDVESNDPLTPHAGVPVTLSVLQPCEPVEIVTVTADISGCAALLSAELGGTPPHTYGWDFGPFGASTEPAPAVDFGVSGTYPYTLTISNCDGAYADTMTGTVTVACEPACEPVEILTVTHEITGCAVAFGAGLAGTEPFSYTWDYGLGVSFAATPEVDFGVSGTYPYTLTVANCAGAYSDTVTGTVSMACEAPRWYVYLPVVVRQGP